MDQLSNLEELKQQMNRLLADAKVIAAQTASLLRRSQRLCADSRRLREGPPDSGGRQEAGHPGQSTPVG
jgi:hypothetical protein